MSMGGLVEAKKQFATVLVATLLVCAISVPSKAYPPGRRLTVALGLDMIVAKNGQTSLSIANARPGTITVQVGKFKKISIAQSGFSSKVLKGYPSGIHDVKVTSPVWFNQPDEIALTRLYVPQLIAPIKGDVLNKTSIAIKYVKPGSIISVTPTNLGKKGRTIIAKVPARKTVVTVSLPARTFSKGSNNFYEVSIGPKIKLKYRFTGR